MFESSEAGNGKTRKRQTAKVATRQAAVKVKSTIHLSEDASHPIGAIGAGRPVPLAARRRRRACPGEGQGQGRGAD